MATSSGDSRSVLDDPLKAPAIGMTDRLHDDDSPLESPSMDASATKDHHAGQDASSLNQEGGGHDPSANEENEWEDLDDEENLSLYEEMLDATDHEGGEMDQGNRNDKIVSLALKYQLIQHPQWSEHSRPRRPRPSVNGYDS